VVVFPNVIVMFNASKPAGGTKASSVEHIGFQVRDLRALLDRIQKNGYPVVTRAELPSGAPATEHDGIATIAGAARGALVMGPDDGKIELYEVPKMTDAIAMHHVHFHTPQPAEMRAWYSKVFGAQSRSADGRESATLPGFSLVFDPSSEPVVPTKGRA